MIGWYQAFLAVLLWGVANVYQKFSLVHYQVQPVVFSCAMFLGASFTLLIVGGQGALITKSLKLRGTWVYAISLLLMYIVSLYLFMFLSATEAGFLQRSSVVVAFLLGWLVMKRRPSFADIIGTAVVIIGLCMMFVGVNPTFQQAVLMLLIISAFVQALKVFIAEMHPIANREELEHASLRARLRLVGFVMLVVSLVSTALSLFLAYVLFSVLDVQSAFLHFYLPELDDFTHPASYFMGALLGVTMVAANKYLEFSAARSLKVENFLAVAALAPLFTYAFEYVFEIAGLLTLEDFTFQDILAAILITIGALGVVVLRLYKEYKISPYQTVGGFLEHVGSDFHDRLDSYSQQARDVAARRHKEYEAKKGKVETAEEKAERKLKELKAKNKHESVCSQRVDDEEIIDNNLSEPDKQD